MSINDVLYRLVHSYPGGVKAVAARMGKNAAVLQNKINPNCETHHPYAEDAAVIADITDSDDVADYYCERRNRVSIPVTQHQGASDMELLDLIISMENEKAEMLEVIRKSLQDGMIDASEAQRIRKEYLELVAAIAELISRIEGMVQEPRTVARGK
jgi:hypothetical protein